MRPQAGVSLVQWQARLPVPSRLHQRHLPRSGRQKNTYVLEDQILPHLAAIAILMHRPRQTGAGTRRSLARVTTPARAADLIDSLRTAGVTLSFDPAQQTLRCNEDIALAIGNVNIHPGGAE